MGLGSRRIMKVLKVLFFLIGCFSFLSAEEVEEIKVKTVELKKEVAKKKKPPPVRNSFFHFDLGSGPYPLPIPTFSMGYRKQLGHQGIDLTLQASTIVYLTQAKLSAFYIFYFNPGLHGQIYIGQGLGGSAVFQSSKRYDTCLAAISPELLIGKEYVGRTGSYRLVQMEISFPTYSFGRIKNLKKNQRIIYYPLIVVSYGICF